MTTSGCDRRIAGASGRTAGYVLAVVSSAHVPRPESVPDRLATLARCSLPACRRSTRPSVQPTRHHSRFCGVSATEKTWRCGCGRVYTLQTLPEKCECGVEHFGDWARVNAKIRDAVLPHCERLGVRLPALL